MGIDIVYNYGGREIYVGDTALVKEWLIKNHIPRDYRVLVEGFSHQPITVNRYLDEVQNPDTPSPYLSFEGVTKLSNDPQFVDKYFVNDPRTDTLVSHNSHLENGMKIICANPGLRRTDEEIENNAEMRYVAMTENRWAVVKDLKLKGQDCISFIGVYDDGTQIPREYSVDRAWYVKKDTMPKPPAYISPGTEHKKHEKSPT